jgi:type IV pilus assembly protein PilW
MSRHHCRRRAKTGGFTLVEMMVAMVVSLILVIAALSTLIISSRGYSTLDAASQLRQNGNFVVGILKRIANQAGFKDIDYATKAANSADDLLLPPAIYGLNNKTFNNGADLAEADFGATAWRPSQLGAGSDVLVLRYQPAHMDSNTAAADQSLTDCTGSTPKNSAISRGDRALSIFYIKADTDGEPSLYCAATKDDDRTQLNNPVALVQGVESFQALYGVQSKSATPGQAFVSSGDNIPYVYLRADQMTVANDPTGAQTTANWRLVRSIRIGLVLRGVANSQQSATEQTFYPLGTARKSSTDALGSAFASDDDPGTRFVAAADGRFRDTLNFTIHLRNDQSL